MRRLGFVLAIVVGGCQSSTPPPAPPAPPVPAVSSPAEPPAPAPWEAHVLGGARVLVREPAVPANPPVVVVGLHGLGGSPENFARAFADYRGPARLVLVEAFEDFRPRGVTVGHQWFAWPADFADADLAAAITATEAKLWPVVAAIADATPHARLVVTGFSQGAVLTFALALRHPDRIALAVPIAGRLPPPLLPAAPPARLPALVALHGDADPRIDLALDRATVAALGPGARLETFPGIGHQIAPAMQQRLFAAIDAVAAQP